MGAALAGLSLSRHGYEAVPANFKKNLINYSHQFQRFQVYCLCSPVFDRAKDKEIL